jgi:hypothetical protein
MRPRSLLRGPCGARGTLAGRGDALAFAGRGDALAFAGRGELLRGATVLLRQVDLSAAAPVCLLLAVSMVEMGKGRRE